MKLSPFPRLIRPEMRDSDYGLRDIALSIETLEQHAVEIASIGTIKCRRIKRNEFPALDEDEKILNKSYLFINEESQEKSRISPVAQWILDNYYLLEEQLKDLKQNMDMDFISRLPCMSPDPHSIFPRTYYLAAEMVMHTDCAISEELIKRFLKAYQSESPLTMNEVWAIPMMLKIALVKSASAVAAHFLESQRLRNEAEKAAKTARDFNDSIKTKKVFDGLCRYETSLRPSFVEHFLQILRDGKVSQNVFAWLDKQLERKGTTAEKMIQAEHRSQTKDQAIIGNAITGLRMLTALPWEEIFESLSMVEQKLREDPTYASMDFDSRDHYRKRIQNLSEDLKVSEILIAAKAYECTVDKEGKAAHVGYYLIGMGQTELLQHLFLSPSLKMRFFHTISACSTGLYLGLSTVISVGITISASLYFSNYSHITWGAILIGILALFPAASAVNTIINRITAAATKPAFIPKMDFLEFIPDEFASIVVVPVLLTSEERTVEIIERMEVYYLANQSSNLYFALLGDFSDCDKEHKEGEDGIVQKALKTISDMNTKYARNVPVFYYIQRKRKYNEKEKRYMGYERKRGALMEFNELLLGSAIDPLEALSSTLPQNIKYVITLDADTQLPRDTAAKLIGAMAHPLNRAVYSNDAGKVIEGYGIMQPRIGITVRSALRSVFAMTYSGEAGIDTYTKAVSDPYMDITGEGIFTGKGIYDLKVFANCLKDMVRDNTILSHDLLEGSLCRTALVTDTELIDGYPSNYISWSKRQHRWIRGDWQLLPWLKSKIKNRANHKIKNPLSFMDKWKISDNLRRSFQPVASVLLLTIGFTCIGGNPAVWMLFSLLPYIINILLDLIVHFVGIARRDTNNKSKAEWEFIKTNVFRYLLFYLFIVYEAFINIDAIIRTLWRMGFSGKHKLQWVTAADEENKTSGNHKDYWLRMFFSPAFSILFNVLSVLFAFQYWPVALLISIPWMIAPWIAWRLSQKPTDPKVDLTKEETAVLRLLARRTWRYFEEYSTTNPYHLIPDNYQFVPRRGAAQRTSPTNIGLQILSCTCACHMGYICIEQSFDYISKVMASVDKMEKWNGHIYNWYDTTTLKPLRPTYVSSVDSGNFAGYLVTAAESIKHILISPIFTEQKFQGLKDTFSAINDKVNEPHKQDNKVSAIIDEYDEMSESYGGSIPLYWANVLETVLNYLKDEIGKGKKEFEIYLQQMNFGSLKEIQALAPWVALLRTLPDSISKSENEKLSFDKFLELFGLQLSVNGIVEGYETIIEHFSEFASAILKPGRTHSGIAEWLRQFEIGIADAYANAKRIKDTGEDLIIRMYKLAMGMDFSKLYDARRGLFSIGYDVENGKLSNSFYDMFASESRLTSFFAVAKGEVPQKHWFKLGRPLTIVNGRRVLISWGGTMFEYLMPLITMKNHPMTLLGETCETAVAAQEQWGESRHIPWGASESAYYAFDLNMNYQYKAFGIPKLGFKSGLAKDAVVTPYASCLALMVSPRKAYTNILRLISEGMLGDYGFYEAIDYMRAHSGIKKKGRIVKSFMAHHQGMVFTSIFNVLNNNLLQDLFHKIPMIGATELLLEEKIPVGTPIVSDFSAVEYVETKPPKAPAEQKAKEYNTIPNGFPKAHLLSNGYYSVMVSDYGTGYSVADDIYISRWRPDPFSYQCGVYFYLKEQHSGRVWSATYAPVFSTPSEYIARFENDKAVYSRKDGDIQTKMEVCVSPEFNAEFRRLTLKNNGNSEAEIEVTSFYEASLDTLDTDMAHQAFSKLFLQTEWIEDKGILLIWRRNGTKNRQVYSTCCLAADEKYLPGIEYDSDRLKFLGRCNGTDEPDAIREGVHLSNSSGCVIDPCMSLRKTVTLQPGEIASMSLIIAVAESRKEVLDISRECGNQDAVRRAFDLAWTHSQVESGYLGITPEKNNLFQTACSLLIYQYGFKKNQGAFSPDWWLGRHEIWRFGLSGDNPLIVLKLSEAIHIAAVKEILQAHEFWRRHGLRVDIAIINEYGNDYFRPLQEQLVDLVNSSHAREQIDSNIRVLEKKDVNNEQLALLERLASIVIDARKGGMEGQLEIHDLPSPIKKSPHGKNDYPSLDLEFDEKKLTFFNGYGGFEPDGTYAIKLHEGKSTPMPWSNILSNERFGSLVTERGAGYTWEGNSHLNMVSPWSNDPIRDPFGEAIYIRDEVKKYVWNATPGPCTQKGDRSIRHGYGFSQYCSGIYGIKAVQTVFVDSEDAVKFTRLTLSNRSGERREISITYFMRWAIAQPSKLYAQPKNMFIHESGALCAQAPETMPSLKGIAYIYSPVQEKTYTSDMEAFIGYEGCGIRMPSALLGEIISNPSGTGKNACGVIQTRVQLDQGAEIEIIFLMGFAKDMDEIGDMVKKYSAKENVDTAYRRVQDGWTDKLYKIQVKTPDPAFDLLFNGRLIYQLCASRLMGKTGFYQAGGAFGFRDQMQDALALLHMHPEKVRGHILLCARNQFIEGDVMHWWHPPTRGVRTKISDDRLFLPYAVNEYIRVTGDASILFEEVEYLEAPELNQSDTCWYGDAKPSNTKETILLHCIKAIERSLDFGEHGLPLMHTGDWNDGMDKVGEKGQGESVWLGFFLIYVLNQFSKVCKENGYMEKAESYIAKARMLTKNVQEKAWDGNWYIRAFFDDGTPLGSSKDPECRIDNIAQSWAVISGVASGERARECMFSALNSLADFEKGIIKLFTPPFDTWNVNPGYIKGYLPGVRENGGQYTHAGTWLAIALAEMGWGDDAYEVFSALNPINHALTKQEVSVYKTEPYAVAADVYAAPGQVGRGGWTWYTGSAAWMYRVALEWLLGFKKESDHLSIKPVLPSSWDGYVLTYLYNQTEYSILIKKSHIVKAILDGLEVQQPIRLTDDGKHHDIIIEILGIEAVV